MGKKGGRVREKGKEGSAFGNGEAEGGERDRHKTTWNGEQSSAFGVKIDS